KFNHQRTGIDNSAIFINYTDSIRSSTMPVCIFYFLSSQYAYAMDIVDGMGPVDTISDIKIFQLIFCNIIKPTFRQNNFWLSTGIIRIFIKKGICILYVLCVVRPVSFRLIGILVYYVFSFCCCISPLNGAFER
ncbi:MAG: hypothetical protein C0490_06700, partial [Marivirga sp.]|nr:hypothetical protein [Marivirga sp.]